MIEVVRILPYEYFFVEGIFVCLIVLYIAFRKDFEARNVFFFGTFVIGFVEALALYLGFRTYEPIHFGIYIIISLAEGGGAFSLAWLISTKLFFKIKKRN